MSKSDCPACGGSDVEPHDGDLFHCRKCGGIFDSTSDEGGSYLRDPVQNAISKEEFEIRERRRRARNRKPGD